MTERKYTAYLGHTQFEFYSSSRAGSAQNTEDARLAAVRKFGKSCWHRAIDGIELVKPERVSKPSRNR